MHMDYRSPFSDWHQAASVRAMPAAGWLTGGEGAWMPEEAGSLLAHPEVRPHARPVAAGLLLASLGFTVSLESRLISPVALDIAAGALRASYGACRDAVVADALRVQCDEAYHAVLAQELIGQVRRMSGVRPPEGEHPFLVHVDQLALTFPAEDAPLVRFCAAVVSETLITKTLRDDWLDGGLQQDLRSFLRHHYQDEVRHSAYFAQLLQLVWPQWTASLRAALRPIWPGLVDAFLDADDAVAVRVLRGAGFATPRACEIVAGCARGQGSRRNASTQLTFHALRRAGAVQDGDTAWAPARGVAR
ncbi:MAG: diiron oxygenase [Pseudomonadota bacterium]